MSSKAQRILIKLVGVEWWWWWWWAYAVLVQIAWCIILVFVSSDRCIHVIWFREILSLLNWRRTRIRCYFAFYSWIWISHTLAWAQNDNRFLSFKSYALNHLSLFPLLWHRHLETGGSLIDEDMHWDCIIHAQAHLSNIFTKPKWTKHFYTKCNIFLPPYVHRYSLDCLISLTSTEVWSLKWWIQKVNKVKEV